MRYSFLLALTFIAFFGGCESWFDSGSKKPTTDTVSGTSVDGYLKNALICLDANGNFTCDDGETTTTTDENGAFSLKKIRKESIKYILVIGGTDTSTGEDFDNILSFTADFGDFNFKRPLYVTPITNLETLLYDSEKEDNPENTKYDELLKTVSDRIKTDFGLSDDSTEQDPMGNNNLFSINQKIQQFIEIISKVIIENDENGTSYKKKDLNKAFVKSIKKLTKINNFEPDKVIADLEDSFGFSVENKEELVLFLNEVETFYDELRENTQKIDSKTLQNTVNKSIREATKDIKKIIKSEFVKIKNSILIENIIATNMSFTVEQGKEFNSTLSAFSKSGTVSFELTSLPSHGNILNEDEVSNGDFIYKADSDYVGHDLFSFIAKITVEGITFEADGNVTISIIPEQVETTLDIPESELIVDKVAYKNETIIEYLATDIDSTKNLDYELVSQPQNGTLTLPFESTKFQYVPNEDFIGSDSFQYKVLNSDDKNDYVTIFVSIEIVEEEKYSYDSEVELNLEYESKTFDVVEDNYILGYLVKDTNTSIVLSYDLVEAPLNGEVKLNFTSTQFKYIPDADFYGTDSFVYKAYISDEDGEIVSSKNIEVTLNVTNVNDAPTIASSLNFTVSEDKLLSTKISVIDNENDDLTFEVLTQPTHGILSDIQSNGAFSYDSDSNYYGTDYFSYRVTDSNNASSDGNVTINIVSVGDKPIYKDLEFSMNEDSVFEVDLRTYFIDENIIDDTTHRIELVDNSGLQKNGTANISDNFTLKYIPNSDFNGEDIIHYQIVNLFDDETTLYSDLGEITVSIANIYDAPKITQTSDIHNINEDNVINGTLYGYDGDGYIEFVLSQAPHHGAVVFDSENKTFEYVPSDNFFGTDSFIYYATDGENNSTESAEVNITIASVEDIPVAQSNMYKIKQAGSLTEELIATDGDGDPLTFEITQHPTDGNVTIYEEDGAYKFLYQIKSDLNKIVTFKFKANDGKADSNEASIDINVTNENFLPHIISPRGTIVLREDTIYKEDIVVQDQDDPRHFIYHIQDGAIYGYGVTQYDRTTEISNIYYEPDPNWNGIDTMQYYATDDDWDYDLVDLTFDVRAVPDVTLDGYISTKPDKNETIVLTLETNETADGNRTYEAYFSDEDGVIFEDKNGNKLTELISTGAKLTVEQNKILVNAYVNSLEYNLTGVRVVAFDSESNQTSDEVFHISEATFDISDWWNEIPLESFSITNQAPDTNISIATAEEITVGDSNRNIDPSDFVTIHIQDSDGNYLAQLFTADLFLEENEDIRSFLITVNDGSQQLINLDEMNSTVEGTNTYTFVYQLEND